MIFDTFEKFVMHARPHKNHIVDGVSPQPGLNPLTAEQAKLIAPLWEESKLALTRKEGARLADRAGAILERDHPSSMLYDGMLNSKRAELEKRSGTPQSRQPSVPPVTAPQSPAPQQSPTAMDAARPHELLSKTQAGKAILGDGKKTASAPDAATAVQPKTGGMSPERKKELLALAAGKSVKRMTASRRRELLALVPAGRAILAGERA